MLEMTVARSSLEPSAFARCHIRGIRPAFLFGDDFDRADRWVVHCGSEVHLDFALGRGFNMLKGFDQRLEACLAENSKSVWTEAIILFAE